MDEHQLHRSVLLRRLLGMAKKKCARGRSARSEVVPREREQR
jgi:hypothetical protein